MEKEVRLTVKLVNLQKKTLGLDLPKRKINNEKLYKSMCLFFIYFVFVASMEFLASIRL